MSRATFRRALQYRFARESVDCVLGPLATVPTSSRSGLASGIGKRSASKNGLIYDLAVLLSLGVHIGQGYGAFESLV